MQVETEAEFCARREAEERAAALAATDQNAWDAHFVMAERYADRASAEEERAATGHPASPARRPRYTRPATARDASIASVR